MNKNSWSQASFKLQIQTKMYRFIRRYNLNLYIIVLFNKFRENKSIIIIILNFELKISILLLLHWKLSSKLKQLGKSFLQKNAIIFKNKDIFTSFISIERFRAFLIHPDICNHIHFIFKENGYFFGLYRYMCLHQKQKQLISFAILIGTTQNKAQFWTVRWFGIILKKIS